MKKDHIIKIKLKKIISFCSNIYNYKFELRLSTFIIIILIMIIIFPLFKFISLKQNKLSNNTQTFVKSKIEKEYNSQINHKKKIYVKFLDFWSGFDYQNFELYSFLKERYEVILSDNPDYIIYDIFGKTHLKIGKKYDCINIFWNIENTIPNFEGSDYLIGLHYLFFGDRYFRKPTNTTSLTNIGSLYNLSKITGKDFRKKKFCAWVVSNGRYKFRNNFYEKLSQYKTVDMGGRYKNNVGGIVKDKIKFLSDYKFSLCFENSKTDGYISEKLFEAFEAGTIPIYYGDDTVLELINNKSYIHIRDESEYDEKIKLIKKIDNDDKLYEKIIKEKIVLDDYRYSKEEKKYKDFIYHIFDQDKEKAKRFKRK